MSSFTIFSVVGSFRSSGLKKVVITKTFLIIVDADALEISKAFVVFLRRPSTLM